MEEISVLIVEKRFKDAQTLHDSLATLGYQVIGQVDNSAEALEIIFAESPDLVIMDVEIQGKLNGMELGQRLQHYDIPILFTTTANHPNYNHFTQQNPSSAFLLKPFNLATLTDAIEKVLAQTTATNDLGANGKNDSIFIKHNNNLRRVPFEQINFIQSEGNYSIVHTNERKYAIKISLRRIQHELPNNVFIQIHQRYVVPLRKISNIELSTAKVVVGENTLPLGRTYKADLLEHFRYLK